MGFDWFIRVMIFWDFDVILRVFEKVLIGFEGFLVVLAVFLGF